MRFEVGDRVRIRDWNDMATDFIVDYDGDISFDDDLLARISLKTCDIFAVKLARYMTFNIMRMETALTEFSLNLTMMYQTSTPGRYRTL